MAYHKRSMKHRKSSRRHLKARRTRARRGGKKPGDSLIPISPNNYADYINYN